MRDTYTTKEQELIVKILKWSETTSYVRICFGYTNKEGQCRKGLVLEDCAPLIVKKLQEEGCITHLEDGRLHITIL